MKIVVMVLLIVSVVVPGLAAEQGISAKTKISAVTVYTDRAMVTRTASVDLQAGVCEIRVDNLPANILEESLRVSGSGSASVRISGMDVKKVFLERPEDARVKTLESEVRKLEDSDISLADKAGVLESKRTFLESFGKYSSDKIEKETALQKMDLQNWQAALSFMVSSLNEINENLQSVSAERRNGQEKLQALRRELDEIKQKRPLEKRSVSIAVEAEKPGIWNLALSYVVVGAGWVPVYDVRAVSATKEMDIAYRADVVQMTGEDWEDVELSLSTAKPAMGAKAPELYPWYVRIIEPMVSLDDLGVMKMAKAGAAPAEMEKKEQAVRASVQYAAPQVTLTSMVLKVLKKESIPGDGTTKKVTVAMESLKPLFEYVTVPKVSPVAFLRAEVTNITDYTFLAGTVNVFQDIDYMGRSYIQQIVPNDTFVVDLGVDERVKCERKLTEKKKEFLLFAKERINYGYKITIQSFKATAETITVYDQVPVSQDERVVVKVKKATSGIEPDEKGIMKWRFSIGPQEKKEIVLEFAIDYPKGMVVSGAE